MANNVNSTGQEEVTEQENKPKVVKVSAPPSGHDEELVPVRLFRDGDKYKDDVYVSVNGERVRVKRGVTVKIKRKFARVLEQSERQDTATAEMIAQMSAEYEAQAKVFKI